MKLYSKYPLKAKLTVKEVKERLLDIIIFVNILAFPVILLGAVEAIELQQIWTAISFVIFYFPLLVAFLFRKKISFNISAFLLLFSGFSIAVVNVIVYGFSGAGIPLFCVISVLATLFYNSKIGFITIFISTIPMIIVAILMTNNFISPGVDLMEISTLSISWITAIVVMVFLGSIMIYGFGIIQENLTDTLNLSKKQMRDLLNLNEEYETINEELKQSNTQLLVSQKKAEESDQLKTEFFNNMSHEIRTPLNGILGFSKFLDKENLSEGKRKYYISIIQNSGNQLMRIIDDILEISQLGTKQVKIHEKEVLLNDLLLEQFSIFDIKAKAQKIPLYLKKGLSDKRSIILTDETKLNKILGNLLENALKFTNEGFIEFGYTLVETRRGVSQSDDTELSDKKYIEIYVKDTGIGIKPESQKIIFDRFSQEEKELSKVVGGLGLGLSIAKENAELLGGTISLESEKGKGSSFFVTIPYKPVSKSIDTMTQSHRINKNGEQKKYTVLIVEDEEINYLYLDTLLEDLELNLKKIHAKNGKEAIEICKENLEIDLILMDLKMPIMNGFEATKLIKEFRPNLPIVAQTAYSTSSDRNKAILAGCNDFISKPISEETLTGIINKYLMTSN